MEEEHDVQEIERSSPPKEAESPAQDLEASREPPPPPPSIEDTLSRKK